MAKDWDKDANKKLSRDKAREFIDRKVRKKDRKGAKVFCLAGRNLAELHQVYLPLGFEPRNIHIIEQDRKELALIREEVGREFSNRNRPVVPKKPVSALDFVRTYRGEPFRVGSLDYCGYYTIDSAMVLAQMALNGSLKASSFVLWTNHLKGRERIKTQELYASSLSIVGSGTDPKDMDTLKDIFLSSKNSGSLEENRERLLQFTPVSCFANGVMWWNTPTFQKMMDVGLVPNGPDGMSFRDYANANPLVLAVNMSHIAFFERNLEEFSRTAVQALCSMELGRFVHQDHECYEYVSDVGHAMLTDLFHFKRAAYKRGKRLFGLLSVGFSQSKGVGVTYHKKDQNIILSCLDNYFAEDNKMAARNARFFAGVPYPRIKLDAGLEGKVVAELVQKPAKVEVDKDAIYAALREGVSEEQIREEHGLSTRQLGAYKAVANRGNGNGSSSSNITFEDREEMLEYLLEGFDSKEVAGLFDGKYSWQQVAGVKASLTRAGNGGVLTGEALFNSLKPQILERDDYTCQAEGCGRTNDENQDISGHRLHVHHIDYDHGNSVPGNLVALCTSCHAKTNTMQHGPTMQGQLEAYVVRFSA